MNVGDCTKGAVVEDTLGNIGHVVGFTYVGDPLQDLGVEVELPTPEGPCYYAYPMDQLKLVSSTTSFQNQKKQRYFQ